jgi:PAS domain S-box-containing protein
VEAVRFPLVVLTPDLRVKSANAAFYDTFQVTRDETENVLLSELDNQQWNIPELLQLLTKVLLENEEVAGFEIEHDFEQIGRRTMLVYARPLDGAPLILVGMVDLTERKRAEAAVRAREQRLRKILETEAVGVLFFDKQGSVVDANGVFLRMTGYSRGEIEARELTWRKMTPPEWVETSEEQMRKLETTGHLGPYEKECLLKDGSRSWMLFAGAELDDGTIVEYCVEIGDRKRAEEDRELLTRELSHRVKNLLAVVQALAIQTDGRIQSVEAYRESFVGRLQATGPLARPSDRRQLAECRPQDADRTGGGGLPGRPSGAAAGRGRAGDDRAEAGVGAQSRAARARHQRSEIRRHVPAERPPAHLLADRGRRLGPARPTALAGAGWTQDGGARRERLRHGADGARLHVRIGRRGGTGLRAGGFELWDSVCSRVGRPMMGDNNQLPASPSAGASHPDRRG